MSKFRIVTPKGASFTVAGGGYGFEKEALDPIGAEIVEKPEIKAQLATLGMDAFSGTPEQLGTFVSEQLVLWERLIKNAGIEKQ